ncbi:MAG TPA: hypothetical protein VES20_10770 [Bryobacteraceae bacterium]|nr:hypothetical protein [Bryobacteraceae bacterium]
MQRWAAAVLVSGLLMAGERGEPGLRQEGGYWVQTDTRTIPIGVGALRIQARGPVRVRGTAAKEDGCSLRLVRKVRAKNAGDAKRLLSQISIRSGPGSVVLSCPERSPALTELEVQVPALLRQLDIHTHSGDLAVSQIAGDVRVQTGAGAIEMEAIRGSVFARTAGGNIRMGHIGGSANCVSGGGSIDVGRVGRESWFDTAGGEIRIGETGGPLHASTSGGNIHVGRALSTVAARTAGGRIDVMEAQGVVVAGNSGGSIHVGAAVGVRLESTGGSIRLKGSSGALRAVSDVGSILAELISGLSLQDSLLSTGAGDITVYIPSDMPLTIEALNENRRDGRIVSEFIEVPVRYSSEDGRRAARAEGTLNGGGPLLKLTSASGTIYLRRRR